MTDVTDLVSVDKLSDWVADARERTRELVADLNEQQMTSPPYMAKINPPLWEIAHLTWFQEKFVLRDLLGQNPAFDDVDPRYDSSVIGHEQRWSADLFSREKTYEYMESVKNRILDRLRNERPDEEELYRILYTVYHEDMHTEAFTYTRQTLGYPAPKLTGLSPDPSDEVKESLDEDVEVPGGTFPLGASRDQPFMYDHEKWQHEVEVEPFQIARTPVTRKQFQEFVDAGGYQIRSFWSDEGWGWKQSVDAHHPLYWRRDGSGNWLRRHFHEWVDLEPAKPMIHVNFYEATAYCRWADRRLPTESEWMAAAVGQPANDASRTSYEKQSFPWGDASPSETLAHLDWNGMGCRETAGYPEGESPSRCRQMVGNIWEWTDSTFEPFPGFEPDFYEANSQPWFGSRKVLKGGAWATRSRFIRPEYRNYFTPNRRDLFAGFRTCAP